MALQCEGEGTGRMPFMLLLKQGGGSYSARYQRMKISTKNPNTIGVDDIRTHNLNNDIATKPSQKVQAYKVYIVDEAEKMSQQAQNALLKTIRAKLRAQWLSSCFRPQMRKVL